MSSPKIVEESSVASSLNLATLAAEVGANDGDLVTRPCGEQAFHLIERALRGKPSGSTLVLDAGDIALMDVSFADAAIIKIQEALVQGRYGNRYLILDRPNATVVENIEGALGRRRVKAPILTRHAGGKLRVIGHLERNLREAWEIVAASGELRTRDLADRCKIEVSAASMRLHKLFVTRLLAREEESTPSGRQHVYRLPA